MAREFFCGRCGKLMPWGARSGTDIEDLGDNSFRETYYCTKCRWKKKANRTVTLTKKVIVNAETNEVWEDNIIGSMWTVST